jgi:hypothetical protein
MVRCRTSSNVNNWKKPSLAYQQKCNESWLVAVALLKQKQTIEVRTSVTVTVREKYVAENSDNSEKYDDDVEKKTLHS